MAIFFELPNPLLSHASFLLHPTNKYTVSFHRVVTDYLHLCTTLVDSRLNDKMNQESRINEWFLKNFDDWRKCLDSFDEDSDLRHLLLEFTRKFLTIIRDLLAYSRERVFAI